MRMKAFALRNVKEMLRDPLSYIFGLGMPLVMLLLMTAVDAAIPPEAENTLYRIDSMTPGIAVFGLTFVMLQAALLVSRDRATSLLARLYTSPMTAWDFMGGYALPFAVIGAVQVVITFAAGGVIAAVQGNPLPLGGSLCSMAALLPSVVLFVALGLLLGVLLSDKGAPPACSLIITLSGMLGGIWMPVESIEVLFGIAKCLPFYHCVAAARFPLTGGGELWSALIVAGAAAVLACAAAVALFAWRRRNV